jgi:hypothetical protein
MNESELPELGNRLDILANELYNNLENKNFKEVILELFYKQKIHLSINVTFYDSNNNKLSIDDGLDELDLFKLIGELHSLMTDNGKDNYWNKITLRLYYGEDGKVKYENDFTWDEEYAKEYEE